MPILTFPAVKPRLESLQFVSNSLEFVSDLDGTIQTASLTGGKWGLSQSFVNLSNDEGCDLKAFLLSLRGQSGRAYITPYEATKRRGTGGGTPLVEGASQSGSSLLTSGWSASETVLKAGDYFEVNGEFKMAVADAVSDGTGDALVEFEPALRASPPDNSSLIINNPKIIMMLENDDQAQWQISQEKKYSLSLDWREAF